MPDTDYDRDKFSNTGFVFNLLKTQSMYRWVCDFFFTAQDKIAEGFIDESEALESFRQKIEEANITSFLGTPIKPETIDFFWLFNECKGLTKPEGFQKLRLRKKLQDRGLDPDQAEFPWALTLTAEDREGLQKVDSNKDGIRSEDHNVNLSNARPPNPVDPTTLRKCPFCAEFIQKEAIVCRFCGRDIEAELPEYEWKKCPFCAENIRNDALICRFCGRDLDAIKDKESDIPRNAKGEIILPPSYSIPGAVIDEIHTKLVTKIRAGELWEDIVVPPLLTRGIKPKKLTRFLSQYYPEAWQKGGQTPEGAVNWLQNILNSERDVNKRTAAELAIPYYQKYTRYAIKDYFYLKLGSTFRSLVERSKSRDDIPNVLSLVEFDLQGFRNKVMWPYIREEALKIIEDFAITGDEYVPSYTEREGFLDDIDTVCRAIVSEFERRYTGNDPKNNFRGVASEEEYKALIKEIVADDERYNDDAGIAFVSLRVRDKLKKKDYVIWPEKLLIEYGMR